MTDKHGKPWVPVRTNALRTRRTAAPRQQVHIDPTGGRFGAGLMQGVSLIALGEAVGHNMWIDQTFLHQVYDAAEAQSEVGLKVRFTHPSMSSDGTGKLLGRAHNFRIVGGRVLGDVHFSKSSRKTPEGDLAAYVIQLAEEDPAAAGLSIAFEVDVEAGDSFVEEHHNGVSFTSPERKNKNNYPHIRLTSLRAADFVDDPAANPAGLFDSNSLPREATKFLDYATGLSADRPNGSLFGVDSDRARDFFSRWSTDHGIIFQDMGAIKLSKETPAVEVVDEVVELSAAVEVVDEVVGLSAGERVQADFDAKLDQFTAKFGDVDGARWVKEKLSYVDALEKLTEKQITEIADLREALAAASHKVKSLRIGETKAVPTTPGGEVKEKRTFAETVKRPQRK